MSSALARRERTLEQAHAFLEEMRHDLERAVAAGSDLPPRIRSVHERAGHATPEYRTFAVPIPAGGEGASPAVLSALIARYAAPRPPSCLFLALDAVLQGPDGTPGSVLIAEARDHAGNRLFYMQPFRSDGQALRWGEAIDGGWRDPGEEEMILDAAFGR